MNIKQFIIQHRNELETPCYIFSPQVVINNYLKLKEQLGTRLIVSIKANPCLELLQRISHVARDGYEVASIRELALVAGPGNGIKFINNPSIDTEFLRTAINSKASIIIDSEAIVEKLDQVLREKKIIQPVLIRLNQSILNMREQKITYDHFGVDKVSLPLVINNLKKIGVNIAGFHIFNGSNQFNYTANDTVKSILQLIPQLESMMGYPISLINLGGGFSARWQLEKFDFVEYRKRLHAFPSYIEIFHEAGRGLFSDAGVFVTRIVNTKIINNQITAICDGGIAQNFMLCQTENKVKYYKTPMLIGKEESEKKSQFPIMYVGSSCSQNDILSRCPAGSRLPKNDDLCVFLNCGAYNHTYTVSQFLNLKTSNVYVTKS